MKDGFGSKMLEHNSLGERTYIRLTLFTENQLGEATRMASQSVTIVRYSS